MMLRLRLFAALLLAGLLCVSYGRAQFIGEGVWKTVPSTGGSYTFSGTDNAATAATITQAFNLGTAAAGRVVVVGIAAHAGNGSMAVTAAGTSLSSVVSVGFGVDLAAAQIFSGVVSSGSGSQNVVLTGASTGSNVVIYVWVLNNLNSTSAKHTASATGHSGSNTTSINVTSDDFLFAVTGSNGTSSAGTWTGSTETITVRGATTNNNNADGLGGDVTVVTTNASSTVAVTMGGDTDLVAATWH